MRGSSLTVPPGFWLIGVRLKVALMNVPALSLLFLLLCRAPALADDPGLVREWDLHLKVEIFDWKEYNDAGVRNLKESGELYSLGGSALLGLYDQSLVLKLDGELFGSVVGYRGQTQADADNPTQSERPVTTDVSYLGSDLRGDLGWNFPLNHFSCQPFVGGGYRWWLRELQDSSAVSTDNVPFQASGYTEYWQTVYGRLGARAEYQSEGRLAFFAGGGGKYPLYTANMVDFSGIGTRTFHPVGAWSGFAETGVSYRQLRLTLSYEGFRFSSSSLVQVGTQYFFQPKSTSDIYGLSLGWLF